MTAKLVKNGQDEVVILTGIQTSHHRSTATPQCSPAPGTGDRNSALHRSKFCCAPATASDTVRLQQRVRVGALVPARRERRCARRSRRRSYSCLVIGVAA